MSRVFKILVDIIIIACLLCVVALLVPPLVGVETKVAGPRMDKNIAEGSVAYGVRRPAVTLEQGDEILYGDDASLYVYAVDKVDADNGEVYVTNEATSDQLVLQMNRNATKKVLIVPYIGYGLLAINSKNGLPMLISAAAVLVALFILASVWDKRRKDKKALKHDEDGEYFAALAQSVDQPSKLDEVLSRPAGPAPEPAASATDLPTVMIPDIREEKAVPEVISEELPSEPLKEEPSEEILPAAVLSISEPDEREEEEILPEPEPVNEAAAAAAAPAKEKPAEKENDVPKQREDKPAAAAKPVEKPAEKPVKEAELFDTEVLEKVPDDQSLASLNMSDNEIPDVSDALVAALETTQVSRSDRTYQPVNRPAEPEPEAEEPDEIELAIPVKSADEILDEAYRKGLDPQVITDEVTGVKLVDFSDCF